MGKKQDKTNVMRLLEQKKISYKEYTFECDGTWTGEEIATAMSQNPNQAFKTLVTVGATKKNYVFVIPVNRELNLKKAAKAVGEKNIEMIKAKELLPLTGYVHGGCSPIGMKKQFTTVINDTANDFDTIIFSGGKIGYQVEVGLEDLKNILPFEFGDVVCEK